MAISWQLQGLRGCYMGVYVAVTGFTSHSFSQKPPCVDLTRQIYMKMWPLHHIRPVYRRITLIIQLSHLITPFGMPVDPNKPPPPPPPDIFRDKSAVRIGLAARLMICFPLIQFGTFSVNGEWVCGRLLPLVAKSGPTWAAEHVAQSQLDCYVFSWFSRLSLNAKSSVVINAL